MPAGVEISEAAYKELFFEAARRAWNAAGSRFPGTMEWPTAGMIGLVVGKIFLKMDLALQVTTESISFEEVVEILASGILDFLQMLLQENS